MGKWRERGGGNHVFRARLSQMRENLQTYPPFKIPCITTIFADESLFLAPTVYESGRESISAEDTLCFGTHRV